MTSRWTLLLTRACARRHTLPEMLNTLFLKKNCTYRLLHCGCRYGLSNTSGSSDG
ncbi:unnamed protein product, partial [Nesidiocoris tenuis]